MRTIKPTTVWVVPFSTSDTRLLGARGVEERRGGLGPMGITPFPLPAHQTGRADFPHPASRPASPQSTRRWAKMDPTLSDHTELPEHDRIGETPGATRRHLMAPDQEMTYSLVRSSSLIPDNEVRLRLRLDVELPPKAPELLGCRLDHCQSPLLAIVKSAPEVRALCSAGITRPHSSYGPVRLPREPSPKVTSRARPSSPSGLPRLPVPLFQRAVPSTPADQDGCTCRLLPRPARPSPYLRRVGVRDFTFEACSGFTRITARWIAQPPKAAFVTGLRSIRLPGQTACQLPDQTDNCLGGSFLH